MQFTSRRQPVPSIGKAALGCGFIVGPLHGAVSAILSVLALSVLAGFSGTLTLLSFPIACAFFLLAGLLVARKTQRIAGGTLAGLWTAFISRLFSTLLVAIFNLIYLLPRQLQPGSQVAPLLRLTPFFVLEFLYLCLNVVLGAGFGALGGLFGKDREQEMLPTVEPAAAPSAPPLYVPPSSPVSLEEPAKSTGSTSAVKPSDPNPYGTPFFPPPYPVSPSPYEDLYDDRPDYE
ncbi:hypothetical protein KSF_044910 [Reticulibacter mediterranei]|uniref:Uncharacterized protein n=1 Tax=Reticulibacter mediterranei TaxID=2778369 RepID=A0A8J3IIV0_9CHLR|nr:hypothetical protein [Reticulibacter mediterranei]GHO94443.1 hypothetical protein KSF_044910 [Reticulibacter mediterranei]